ncbi:hypothetical protein Aoki45_20890 [Algoriphagus sp. oki45]|nr:hypothetical protein Aoki45_20890 [Algoriphagus sp. oki45]
MEFLKNLKFINQQKWLNNRCIFILLLHNHRAQRITVTEPNDRWLKQKIEENEYPSKSELIKGEKSGLSTKTMAEILEEAIKRGK